MPASCLLACKAEVYGMRNTDYYDRGLAMQMRDELLATNSSTELHAVDK